MTKKGACGNDSAPSFPNVVIGNLQEAECSEGGSSGRDSRQKHVGMTMGVVYDIFIILHLTT